MTTFAHSVTIGPEFFAKAKRDYADSFWAFAREILQNSLDAGSTQIKICIHELESDRTVIVVENNGEPMTHEILTEKLLALGSSGKDFRGGSVGGFGKAKEILYFAHRGYTIETGSLIVEGSGAGYNIAHRADYYWGTTSTVVWEGLHAERLEREFTRFIGMSHRPDCEFTLNGQVIESTIGRGRFKRNLMHEGQEWAEVRVAGAEPNLVVVRIGGTPMFTSRSDYKRSIVLELKGSSADTLTANRDGLKWNYSQQMGEFLVTLAVDKKSALTEYEPTYHRHAGTRLRYRGLVEEPAVCVVDQGVPLAAAAHHCGGIEDQVQARHEEPQSILAMEFIVKDCLGKRAIPREFDPQSNQFSDHAHWLANAWAGCLLELHELHEITEPFSVGFIFASDLRAETEDAKYGRVYFVNPIVLSARSHRRQFPKSQRHELVALAAHEFVHGALNHHRHDEDYASALTRVMAAVLKNQRRFNRHVK